MKAVAHPTLPIQQKRATHTSPLLDNKVTPSGRVPSTLTAACKTATITSFLFFIRSADASKDTKDNTQPTEIEKTDSPSNYLLPITIAIGAVGIGVSFQFFFPKFLNYLVSLNPNNQIKIYQTTINRLIINMNKQLSALTCQGEQHLPQLPKHLHSSLNDIRNQHPDKTDYIQALKQRYAGLIEYENKLDKLLSLNHIFPELRDQYSEIATKLHWHKRQHDISERRTARFPAEDPMKRLFGIVQALASDPSSPDYSEKLTKIWRTLDLSKKQKYIRYLQDGLNNYKNNKELIEKFTERSASITTATGETKPLGML